MKIDLNLTSAFVLRKRINALSGEIRGKIVCSQLVVEAEEVESVKEKFVTGDLDSDMELYCKLLDANAALSNEIEFHNVSGKCIMNKIQRLHDKEATIQCAIRSLGVNPVRKERNPVTGVWEARKLEKLSNANYEQRLKELAQEKVRLEDELSKVNSSTNFTFDLEDDIYHRIYG